MSDILALIPVGKVQWTDANGNPLVGGKVYFYVPGTTTPKNTWQDPAGTALNTNPVDLDARGEAVVWGSGSYRQIVTDSNGALIWDQVTSDPVAAALGEFLTQPLFTALGANATARTFQDKARDIVSVKDFGGVGSGAVDETAAFSAAAAAVGPAGQVVVPKGTWQLSAIPSPAVTWLVDANATFTGAGSLSGRMVKNGNGGAYAHGTKLGAQSSWLEALRTPTESIADLIVLSSIGQIGIIGGSQTSDFATAGSQGCIGIAGYANNNNTSAIQSAYAGYFEARRQQGTGITQAIEIDIVNLASDVGIVYPGNMFINNLSNGLWIASGGGVAGAQGASLAIGIVANGNNFDKGIVFEQGAVQVNLGEGVAMALAFQQALVWYDGATNKVARIRSDATAPSFGITFSNSTLNLQTIAGANVFTIGTNGVFNISVAGGGYYFNGTQVVAARQAGWGTASGGSKAAFNAATASPAQTAAAVAQLINDLFLHGLIGA
ncbi:hypothetical protein [Burkholderia orbicola]|uniref:hypothetical protein n=1 Tax=Burkholderia orbicola TaxID=2978683 RepID=UPI002655EC4C|nr:hypothetical protein [Burkholderia orbicola]MDN7558231.1 hypothetical protein [Burkholderia orbicola]